MRFFKTTDNGGLPLFLNDIRWFEGGMMDGFISMLSAFKPRDLTGLTGAGLPPSDAFILSGLQVTNAAGNYTWTDGYVYIAGLIYKVPASTAPLTPALGESLYIQPDAPIFSAFGYKLFRNMIYRDTYGTRLAKVEILATPQNGVLNLLYSDRLTYGNVGMSAPIEYTPAAGWTVNEPIRARKLEFGNVIITGRLTFQGGVGVWIDALPVDMRPATIKIFSAYDFGLYRVNGNISVYPDGKVHISMLGTPGLGVISGSTKYDLCNIQFRAGT